MFIVLLLNHRQNDLTVGSIVKEILSPAVSKHSPYFNIESNSKRVSPRLIRLPAEKTDRNKSNPVTRGFLDCLPSIAASKDLSTPHLFGIIFS